MSGESYVGGLTGYLYQSTVEDVYSMGEVKGVGDNINNIGGLVGRSDSGTVKNAYTISKIIESGNAEVGGLVGGGSSTIRNAYWSSATAGISTSDGGTELEDMKIQSNYEGFDFTSDNPIWTMKEYPELTFLVNK